MTELSRQIRFGNTVDRMLFETEVELASVRASETDPDVFEFVDDALYEEREKKVSRLRDFQKSKVTSKQWRTKRKSLMKGIKRYHRSTKGKRFHRKLGRWLAMRDTKDRLVQVETLVAVQSLKTHLSVDLKYSSSMDEEANFSLLYEEIAPVLDVIESRFRTALLNGSKVELDEEHLDLLSDLVHRPIQGRGDD